MKPSRYEDGLDDLGVVQLVLLGIGLMLGLIVTSLAGVPVRLWRWFKRSARRDE